MVSVMYKYQMSRGCEVEAFSMPKGTVVRHVDMQRGVLCLWAEVPPDSGPPSEERRFTVVRTGRPAEGVYVGTVMEGAYVWHVFEVERP
jgi:hypothetical protein